MNLEVCLPLTPFSNAVCHCACPFPEGISRVAVFTFLTHCRWEELCSLLMCFRVPTLLHFVCSQQRLLLIDVPLHNTFLELWTMVHFLIPGISRPYLSFPLKAPNEENQDYYHKMVIRLHRVCLLQSLQLTHLKHICLLLNTPRHYLGRKWLLFSPGHTAIYFEENQERCGKTADQEV